MKRGMKKAFVYFAVFMGVLMLSGVFAESVGLSDDVKDIVNGIAEKQGIAKEEIKSVEKVSLDNLPPQVDLKNIDATNLAVYEVDYGGEQPVYVLTASNELFESVKQEAPLYKMLLNFGSSGEIGESSFLESAGGVEGTLDKGYVMMRDGSITGLSTNLEAVSGEGTVEIIVYINGEVAGFRNTIAVDSVGVKKDYDSQSPGIVKFDKGDVISVYTIVDGVVVKDIINLVEISTN